MKSRALPLSQNGYVGHAGKKGRGVFARRDLPKGSVVEVCTYIETPYINRDPLRFYFFEIDKKRCALALGMASLYNHSARPNTDWVFDVSLRLMTFRTLRLVRKDEELTINYGYDFRDFKDG